MTKQIILLQWPWLNKSITLRLHSHFNIFRVGSIYADFSNLDLPDKSTTLRLHSHFNDLRVGFIYADFNDLDLPDKSMTLRLYSHFNVLKTGPFIKPSTNLTYLTNQWPWGYIHISMSSERGPSVQPSKTVSSDPDNPSLH